MPVYLLLVQAKIVYAGHMGGGWSTCKFQSSPFVYLISDSSGIGSVVLSFLK
jgi:hypothetical protein